MCINIVLQILKVHFFFLNSKNNINDTEDTDVYNNVKLKVLL